MQRGQWRFYGFFHHKDSLGRDCSDSIAIKESYQIPLCSEMIHKIILGKLHRGREERNNSKNARHQLGLSLGESSFFQKSGNQYDSDSIDSTLDMFRVICQGDVLNGCAAFGREICPFDLQVFNQCDRVT
jgi:hypothetical protein